ncbi:MAG: hypothetical protein WC069_04045 [Candidatus Shapirobacteria bacterium]
MKITKMMSFGVLVLSTLLMGMYAQNKIGNKNDVDKFFADLSNKSKEFVEINFPKDLKISINKGKVLVNQKLPYCLLMDKENNKGIIFDNAENPNIKSFETQPLNFGCKPYAIVGKDYVVVKQKESETRIYQIPTEATLEIDQKMLIKNKDKYLPIVEKQGNKLYKSLPMILALFALPWILLANFWYSLVVYYFAKLFKLTSNPEISNRYWIVLLFGSILGIINSAMGYFEYPFISFPFSGSIIIGSASILYLKYRAKNK